MHVCMCVYSCICVLFSFHNIIYIFSNTRNWNGLKRICHTWKGRNSQIGFRKSSLLAASLHDFLQQTAFEPSSSSADAEQNAQVIRQVEMFLGALETEAQTIEQFLKSQYLL